MSPAAALVRLAARRWPADLATDLEREWLAELAALRGRPWRRIAFAGSLAVAPSVDGPSWPERAHRLATPAALTLIAAALCNGVRLAGYHAGTVAAAGTLVVALALMAYAGRRTPPGGVLLLGAGLFAFLFAGNPVAVMPFMGWRDVGPAAAVWTAGTVLTLRVRSRPAAVAGTLLTLDLAVAAGSVHAAAALDVPLSGALLWLPQTLLPGAEHPVLISNAAVMAGVLTFGSAYVLAGRLRSRPARPPRLGAVPAGVGAALVGVLAGEVLRRSPRSVDGVFGFGFLAHPIGLAVAALLVALVAAHRAPTAR